ncbi:MAG: selenium cofactor biosynthesis protein YqeC [Syntrophorhabdales bacterium]
MIRIDPLPSLTSEKFISFVGAGGKTSLAEYLGQAAARDGKRVAITTTTRIWAREPCATFEGLSQKKGAPTRRFVRVGKTIDQGKLTGLAPDEVRALGRDYDLVLVEADGAKGLPLKHPASYEPVIPRFSDRTVVVAGLDALGGTIEERVFRWRLFAEASGLPPDGEITIPVFLRFFEGDSLLKGVERDKAVIVLNKYDACPRHELVPELARHILRLAGLSHVIVASVSQGAFYGVTPG